MLHIKSTSVILFVCLLLAAQSSSKHLFANELAEGRLHIRPPVQSSPADELLAEIFEPLEKPPSNAKFPEERYDFHSHWRKGSVTNESDTLQFFYDNRLTIELDEELDFEYDEFEVNYYYWVYNAQDKTSHSHTIEYNQNWANKESVQFDHWKQMQLKKKVPEPSKKFTLKLAFSKLYEAMTSAELHSDGESDGKGQLDDDEDGKELIGADKRFTIYLNGLTVEFNSASGARVRLDVLNENRFTAQVDFEQVSREQLSNYLLMPRLTDEVPSYHYTFLDSTPFNWTLDNGQQMYSGDICLEFSYQATKHSILQLKVLNEQETSFFVLLHMDGTEISFQETPKSPVFQRTKWSKISLCLRDLFPNCKLLRNFYRLQFESVLPTTTNRREFVAVTDIRTNQKDYKEKNVKSFLTNWKTNGTWAAKEWFNFMEDTQLTVKAEHSGKREITNLQFRLEVQPYTSDNKSVCILSEWFEIEESEEMRFEIVSQLVGARYRIMLFDFQMVSLHSTDYVKIEPNGATSVKFKFLATIVRMLRNKPGRVKLVITYDPKKENRNKALTVHSLHLSDPCHDENLCNKRGECQTPSSNVYQCVCENEYSGNNCEFENKCILENEYGVSGTRYCLEHDGTVCVPVNNDFMCKCRPNYQWDNFTRNCEYVSSCLFKFCGLNEVCIDTPAMKKPICQCKHNYSRDEKTKRCVFDLCKELPAHLQCKENEKCVSVLGEKEPRCICPLENRKKDGNCLAEKLVNNPFIKQYYGCAHTYKYVNGAVVCSCFQGYQLGEDKKSCVGDLSAECTNPKCGFREICVLNKDKKRHECRCQIGFSGPDCDVNYCNTADKEEIIHICGQESCVEQKYESDIFKTGFSCNCLKHVAVENDKTGLCELKPVCTEERTKKCQKKDAICIAALDPDDRFLKYRCVCPKGYLEDFNQGGKCVEMCSVKSSFLPNKEPNRELCVADFVSNQRTFDCNAGFLPNNRTGGCDAGENLLKLNFDFKFRNLDTSENEKEPKFDYGAVEYYCQNLSNKLTCIERLNEEREKENRIESSKLDYFLAYLRSKVTRSIKRSVRNLIDPKLLKRIVVTKIEKSSEDIDFENEGVNSIFSAELFVETEETADAVRQSLEAICVKDSSSGQDEPESAAVKRVFSDAADDEDELVPANCAIRPYLYLMRGEMKISEANLCDSNLVQCNGNSNCEHVRDESRHRSSYRCKCNNGFERRFTAREYNIEVNSCTDIDECVDATLNNCEPGTTTCENQLGRFRCNCNDNYTMINSTHCRPTCGVHECVHGKCYVFEKNYEACSCFDGYKGDRCNIVDGKMATLRSLLATVSILLILSILTVIVITYIYVKKVECEIKLGLLQNEQTIPMDDISSYYEDRIDIRNMPKHSVQHDVIEEEELTDDDEHITDF